ncbi:hypothetical protein DGG96_07350 [Legionella qingyii]|uniref:Uncharacterized protein n=1 Tax=Legionella qingyii TaxID=2184757 RepID=A0A317U6Y5_9GAMM|nr:hypothetical protein DGG96_07350 [Legionella qingyii]
MVVTLVQIFKTPKPVAVFELYFKNCSIEIDVVSRLVVVVVIVEIDFSVLGLVEPTLTKGFGLSELKVRGISTVIRVGRNFNHEMGIMLKRPCILDDDVLIVDLTVFLRG